MAGSASGIKAGRAYVELGTNNNPLSRGLRAAEARLKAFGASVTAMGQRFLAVGLAIGAPLLLAAKSFADTGSALNDMSERTGVSVEALSELAFAAQQTGSNMEELETAIKFMQRGGFGRGAEDLERIADELTAIEDPAQRTARAIEVFGRAGTRIIPLLNNIRALREEARRLGLTMSTEEAKAADDLGDAIDALGASMRRAVGIIGGALAPMLTQLAKDLAPIVSDIGRWIRQNQGLVITIAKVAAVIAGAGVALLILGPLISGVGIMFGLAAAAIGVVIAVVGLLAKTVLFCLTPMGALLVAVDLLRGAAVTMVGRWSGAFAVLRSGFSSILQVGRDSIGGIVEAIRAGDLQGAMTIAGAGLSAAWEIAVASMQSAWGRFRDFVLDVIDELITSIAKFLVQASNIGTAIAQIMSGNVAGAVQTLAGGGAAQGMGAGMFGQLDQMTQEGQAARRRRREAEEAANNDRIRAAQAELQAAIRGVQQARQDAFKYNAMKAMLRGEGNKPPTDPETTLRRFETAGTFSASAAGGLGASSVSSLLEQGNANTRRAADGIGRLAQPAFT